jgi:glycosyltransferase involved in cell wall biosynthesis
MARGGHEIEDWDFGLTTRQRRPKPALAAVSEAFARAPYAECDWPRVSVVVCAYNAARTIGECLDGVAALDYPDYEVIVVDDGSTDATADIAAAHGARVFRTPNRGLSSARNTGLFASTGAIVAYLDSDAFPDPHWLRYLAASFEASTHAGIGGPNIAPLDSAPVAQCVARAPGGPIHVLLSDLEAEHIPGCNMAFRREALMAIGGFDPRYDAAGDDVDVCWRLMEHGSTLGFSPAAMVWHHPRDSVGAYWRQQRGYGRAEALLERRWPEKYNPAGHISWRGRLYGGGPVRALLRRPDRVYHGTWNTGLFQRVYEAQPGALGSLTLMPEWHVVSLGLGVIGVAGLLWAPLLAALLLAIAAVAASAAQALVAGARAAAPEWRRRPGARAARVAGDHRAPPPPAAARAPLRPPPPRAHALAHARARPVPRAPAPDVDRLERALGGLRRPHAPRGGPPRRHGARGRPGRGLRRVGPGRPRRSPGRRAPARDGGGARRGPAVAALPCAAAPGRHGAAVHHGARRGRRRRSSRERLGGGVRARRRGRRHRRSRRARLPGRGGRPA